MRRRAVSRLEGTRANNQKNGSRAYRPAVAGAEDIERADEGGVQAGLPDEALAFGADGDVGAHDGGGLGDAEVNEMPDATGGECSGCGFADGDRGRHCGIEQPWRDWDAERRLAG